MVETSVRQRIDDPARGSSLTVTRHGNLDRQPFDKEVRVERLPITLPSGEEVTGTGPVVVVGPNGSGKTRLSRRLMGPAGPPEFVNALRSTRISPEIQAMSQMQARSNHEGHRQQARNSPWEITSDFDYMLAQILAEDGDAARDYRARSKAGESVSGIAKTPLETPGGNVG
jgi:ATPase subunit of ABC transporter with duplicated ATPase domains